MQESPESDQYSSLLHTWDQSLRHAENRSMQHPTRCGDSAIRLARCNTWRYRDRSRSSGPNAGDMPLPTKGCSVGYTSFSLNRHSSMQVWK